MSESLGKVLSVGEQIEFEGQVYQLSPFSYERRGEFEAWCKRKARAEITQSQKALLRREITQAEHEETADRITKLIGSGYFDAGQEGFNLRLGTLDGKVHMTWLMLQPRHPEVQLATVDRMFRSIFEELLAALEETNRDPNPAAARDQASR